MKQAHFEIKLLFGECPGEMKCVDDFSVGTDVSGEPSNEIECSGNSGVRTNASGDSNGGVVVSSYNNLMK